MKLNEPNKTNASLELQGKDESELGPLEAFRSSFVVGNTECYMTTLLIHRVSRAS